MSNKNNLGTNGEQLQELVNEFFAINPLSVCLNTTSDAILNLRTGIELQTDGTAPIVQQVNEQTDTILHLNKFLVNIHHYITPETNERRK